MLIVDAGPLVAAAAPRERHHERCMSLLSESPGPLVVPALVVAEAAYLIAERVGDHAERLFARSLEAGELLVEPVEPADWPRIVELLDAYADLPLGIVDASVITTCERLGAGTLATLDRRHFSVVRPRHRETLTLLPD